MKDAGLRLLLEAHRDLNKNPQIIDKITMLRPSLPPSSSSPYSPTTLPATGFLDACFLCRKPLSPNSDIYMYRGDRAFCSVACRCRQIFLDEVEETSKKENCSVTAAASRRGKANRNRAGRLFAY